VIGDCGKAASPTVGRKLDAGRNRDRPIRTSKLSGSIAMIVFVSDGSAPRFMNMALQTWIGWGFEMPFAHGKESYV